MRTKLEESIVRAKAENAKNLQFPESGTTRKEPKHKKKTVANSSMCVTINQSGMIQPTDLGKLFESLITGTNTSRYY